MYNSPTFSGAIDTQLHFWMRVLAWMAFSLLKSVFLMSSYQWSFISASGNRLPVFRHLFNMYPCIVVGRSFAISNICLFFCYLNELYAHWMPDWTTFFCSDLEKNSRSSLFDLCAIYSNGKTTSSPIYIYYICFVFACKTMDAINSLRIFFFGWNQFIFHVTYSFTLIQWHPSGNLHIYYY